MDIDDNILQLRKLDNPELIKLFKNENYFILYDKVFIPVRKFNSEESSFISSLITSDGLLVRRPKNEKAITPFSYNKIYFDNFTAFYNVEIFYSLDDNQFCISTDESLNSLNVAKLRKFYAKELLQFNKENNVLISELKSNKGKIDSICNEIKPSLIEDAKPLKIIEYTRANYNILFPGNKIETPIETVKLGDNQFKKLSAKDRELFLDLIYQTLRNPSLIINEFRLNDGQEELSHNYIKSYKDNTVIEGFQSVVVSIENNNISITSHRRDIDKLLKKIKTPEQLNYINPEVRHLIKHLVQNSKLQMVNPTRNYTPIIESVYNTDITGVSNPFYDKNLNLSNAIPRLKASPIPQNVQTISDSVLSFEQNKSDNLDIIGKQFETDSVGKPTLEGMKQLSKAMEIYSDKHYETARYLFVKDGVIIRHKTVTAQIPASTIIKPDEKFLYDLKSYAEETDSKIVFLHNHPSGYVEPSEADIELTDYLTNFFEESKNSNLFCGHIILDHGTYGLYDSKDRSWKALINDEIKPLSEISKNFKIQLTEHKRKASFNKDYTISEQSLRELSEYAKSCDSGEVWNTKDWIPSFLLTGNGIVTSLEYINTLEFNNEDVLSEKLKFLGRKYGSENIIMLPADKQQFLICERYAQDSGKIKDVFLDNKDGTFEFSDFRNGNIFNDLRKDEIIVTDTNDISEKVNEKIIYEQSVNKNTNKQNNKENNTMAKMTNEERAKLTGEQLWDNFNSHMDAVYSQLALEANKKNREVLYIDFNDSFEKELIENYTREQRDYLRDRVKSEYNGVDLPNALSSFKESLKSKYEEDLSVMDDIFFSNTEEPDLEVKENLKTNNLDPAMDISEDSKNQNHTPEQNVDNNSSISIDELLEKLRQKEEAYNKLVKQNQTIVEYNQSLSQKIAALEQQIKAPREAQEKSANDSVGYGGSQSSQEYSNLTNQDGFGRETAYKKNQKVPTFGILQDDGSHQIIKNAVFSKLLVDDENPANNKIELLVLKENGKQEPVQISEKTYNDIINNVQDFEQRKQGQSQDSFEWMKAHLDYAQKMGTDDNSFRLSTAENFIHNFRVHCMRDEAHNPDEALKVAGIMFDRMAKRDKERFLKMRKAWDKKAKIDGGPTFDEHLIKQFNEFHPKKDINIEEIKDRYFNAEEAVDKQNLMYESLRSGKIQGTNTNIGDTISFAMKYKDMFSGKSLKAPKEDWKIVEVSKCLHGDSALIYNEKSKAYYKLPLENLVEQIRKNERIKSKEEKQTIKKDHKKVGYDGPER